MFIETHRLGLYAVRREIKALVYLYDQPNNGASYKKIKKELVSVGNENMIKIVLSDLDLSRLIKCDYTANMNYTLTVRGVEIVEELKSISNKLLDVLVGTNDG